MTSENIKEKFLRLKYNYWCSGQIFCPFPYRKYMHSNKIIFIHIPRSGGTSILRYFNEKEKGRDHSTWNLFKTACPWAFNRYFKFAIVRNPWARIVSCYNYLLAGGNQMDDLVLQKYITKFHDFDDFVCNGLDDLLKRNVTLFKPQTFFICDFQNNIMIDKVLKFEQYNNELKNISIFKEKKLERVNFSQGTKYSEIYTQKSKEKIEKNYIYDIETFGYEFI